ncbi:lytic transglycosylase domain-containing protein [Providencia rettgeri]|uniref:lytic transglycosylase domain-containing protein n=1 Tax=Providencia rettgeri TaxID=587 RepID=UPI001FBAC161|nr:lytic transglycosylase domain-containing protein [Providencia rettgeri]
MTKSILLLIVLGFIPFVHAEQTDEEILLSYLELNKTDSVGYGEKKDIDAWTTAMQERWGKTTPLKDLAFYQQVQEETTQEVNQVLENHARTPSKVNVSQDIGKIVKKYADKYNISEDLVIALIQTESAFNPNATSPKGAKGLMQLMDVHSEKHGIDPYNPEENIQVGTELLARLLYKYNDIKLALAAYNAGEGAVSKYNGIPPYKETKNYVSKVMGLMGE